MNIPVATKKQLAADSGFALIVTVVLLAMLSLVALGFLSLSAVTLRNVQSWVAKRSQRRA